jgi:hypothetical protein
MEMPFMITLKTPRDLIKPLGMSIIAGLAVGAVAGLISAFF